MKFKFENLEIWKKGMELGEDIFNLTTSFPVFEKHYKESLHLMNMMIAFKNKIK